MNDMTIQIGQGESKTINFKITTNQFESTDRLLFAVKTDSLSRKLLISYESLVSTLSLNNGVYTFVVPLTSEQTRTLAIRNYTYDLTLIDEYEQSKPLIEPSDFIVVKTIGASVKSEGV